MPARVQLPGCCGSPRGSHGSHLRWAGTSSPPHRADLDHEPTGPLTQLRLLQVEAGPALPSLDDPQVPLWPRVRERGGSPSRPQALGFLVLVSAPWAWDWPRSPGQLAWQQAQRPGCFLGGCGVCLPPCPILLLIHSGLPCCRDRPPAELPFCAVVPPDLSLSAWDSSSEGRGAANTLQDANGHHTRARCPTHSPLRHRSENRFVPGSPRH